MISSQPTLSWPNCWRMCFPSSTKGLTNANGSYVELIILNTQSFVSGLFFTVVVLHWNWSVSTLQDIANACLVDSELSWSKFLTVFARSAFGIDEKTFLLLLMNFVRRNPPRCSSSCSCLANIIASSYLTDLKSRPCRNCSALCLQCLTQNPFSYPELFYVKQNWRSEDSVSQQIYVQPS
jgi:hypothetical protein